MSNWILVTWAMQLFRAFNTVAPNRPKGSDGSIGDAAHQGQTSGHNPDDTPGVRAERSDSDSIPEVRAIDVTAFERLWDYIQAILRSPQKDCLIYIIYRGTIWRKANGWKAEKYDGSDQHYGHAHFSGDPAYDTVGVDWLTVLEGNEDVRLDEPVGQPLFADFNGDDPDPNMNLTVGQTLAYIHLNAHYARWAAIENGKVLKEILATLKDIRDAQQVPIDLAALADLVGVKVGEQVARQVADETARRMQT